jgi:hypothetical protein
VALKSNFLHTGTWTAANVPPPPPPPRMCCRPVLLFRQLRLNAVSFPQEKFDASFKKRSIFAFLKTGWVCNCLRQGVSTPGLILKVVHRLVPLIYLDYNTGGVIESKVNKEHHLSLSGDVGYSLRVSCKTLEARVVEILSSASYLGGSSFEFSFGNRLSSLDLQCVFSLTIRKNLT